MSGTGLVAVVDVVEQVMVSKSGRCVKQAEGELGNSDGGGAAVVEVNAASFEKTD